MTNVSRNVVSDVLRCIALCTEQQQSLAKLPTHRPEDADKIKQHAANMLHEIEIELCHLAASFVSAPMSGRMFIPLPNAYTSEQDTNASRPAQLRFGRA